MNKFLMFIFGAAVGAAVGYQLAKRKYEQSELDDACEQIIEDADEGKAKFMARLKADIAKNKPNVTEYSKRLNNLGYTNYSDINSKEDVDLSEEEPMKQKTDLPAPYVISPDEFGEKDGFETFSLTYYSDGVLCDSQDEPLTSGEFVIGNDALNRFGEYEADSVFVRNETLEADYEILADTRKYAEVAMRKPHEVV